MNRPPPRAANAPENKPFKHREIIAQVEAEPGLPKSLRRYVKKEDEILC